jgi:hypothetical protein
LLKQRQQILESGEHFCIDTGNLAFSSDICVASRFSFSKSSERSERDDIAFLHRSSPGVLTKNEMLGFPLIQLRCCNP